MRSRRRRLLVSAALAAAPSILRVSLAFPLWAGSVGTKAAHAFDLLEDHDFRLIAQQPLADTGGVEVVEFFYYGCEWCFQLEPYLEDWLRNKPADVSFRRVPALRNRRWITMTRAFYAFDALGVLPRLHSRAYDAYHREYVNLEDEAELFKWAARQGIPKDRFELAYRSDKVSAAMLESRDLTAAYEIETTPTLVVAGRYLTSTGMAGGVAEVIPILDQLVQLAREERAKRR